MSSYIHIDNKKKDILVLRRGQTQGLESTLTAEKMYSINFAVTKKKVCIIMEQIVIYLLMVQKFVNLKQKIMLRKYFKRLVNGLYEKNRVYWLYFWF